MHDSAHMSDVEPINTAEAAKRLNVNRSTVTRWVKAGRIEPTFTLPGYRGDHLFDPAAVDALAGSTDE